VDTTKTITHVSLCAGYGGIDLGLGRAIPNLRTIAFSEIEAFACANLVSKMEAGLLDAAPIWTDLKTFPWAEFCDRVDILSGGYPCQPFSAAGKRLGKEDPRHLWPWIADGIASMRPRIVFFENVEGHISLGLREVIEDLERLGYNSTWGIFSASEIGAPHQRKRVFILAYYQRQRIEELGGQVAVGSQQYTARNHGFITWPTRPGEPQHEWEPPRVVGNTESKQSPPRDHREQQRSPSQQEQIESGGGDCGPLREGYGEIECEVGRDSNESTDWMGYAELFVTFDNRTDELRLLGNGVVPATAERAFRVLLNQILNQ